MEKVLCVLGVELPKNFQNAVLNISNCHISAFSAQSDRGALAH